MPAPPTVEPDASPTTCIEINETWASWVSGRIWEMEHEEFWESDQDAAIDKASTLNDIFAEGNCEPVMTQEFVLLRINLGADLTLPSTTRVTIGAPFQLTVNPPEPAKYLVHFEGVVRNNNVSGRWLHMYMSLPGQVYFPGLPIVSINLKPTSRQRLSWTQPTGSHGPGATLIDFQYEVSGGGIRFEQNASALPGMYTIWAQRYE